MVINDFVLSFVVDHPRLPDFSYIFLQSQVQPNLACFWPGCKACFDQDKPFECVKLNDGFDARWITTLNDIFKGEVGETRIPMPLISENTCFCAKHGNKMRKKYNTDSRADSPHGRSGASKQPAHPRGDAGPMLQTRYARCTPPRCLPSN